MRTTLRPMLLGLGIVATVCGLLDVLALVVVRPVFLQSVPLLFLPGALLGCGGTSLLLFIRSYEERNRLMLSLVALVGLAIGIASTTGPAISTSVWRWPLVGLSLLLPPSALWLLSRASRRLAIPSALVGIFALFAADFWVLPRLYPAFHAGLIFFVFVLSAELLFRNLPGSLREPRVRFCVGGLGVFGLLGGAVLAMYFAMPGMPVAAKILAFRRSEFHTHVQDLKRTVAHEPSRWDWRGRDIIFITIDAVRADMLEAKTMPRLSDRARSAVRFEQVSTPTPNSSYALASLHTGAWVHAAAMMELPLPTVTIAESLRGIGYRSLAVYPGSVFSVDGSVLSDYARTTFGFERYVDQTPSAQDVCELLKDALQASEQPLFFWAHLMDPHQPYEPSDQRFGDQPAERYRAELYELDEQLDVCLSWIIAHPRRPVVMVTSDHGEAFGEHRSYYHGSTLYQEQLHVPLLLFGADVPDAEVMAPVSLIDIAPTVLFAVGRAAAGTMFGYDLSRPEQLPNERVVAVLNDNFAVRQGMKKALCLGPERRCDLYSLVEDPNEERPRGIDVPWASFRIDETLGWMHGAAPSEGAAPPSLESFSCEKSALTISVAKDGQAALFRRIRALRALSACPEKGQRLAVELLDDGYMSVEAAHYLGLHGTSEALSPLRHQLKRETFLAGQQALHDAIMRLERRAAEKDR